MDNLGELIQRGAGSLGEPAADMLVDLDEELNAAGANFMQKLRESEFLNAIKHRSAIPGGTCEFDLPDFFYWLNQDAEARVQTFNEWLGMLRPLCDAIAELLWLTRQNGRQRQETAVGGTFKDPSFRPDMKRVGLRAGLALTLGNIVPPAALLATIELGPGDDVQCGGKYAK